MNTEELFEQDVRASFDETYFSSLSTFEDKCKYFGNILFGINILPKYNDLKRYEFNKIYSKISDELNWGDTELS